MKTLRKQDKIEHLSEKYQSAISLVTNLSSRERVILDLRYSERKTQREVAEMFRITNERIRQLEDDIIKKIKKYIV